MCSEFQGLAWLLAWCLLLPSWSCCQAHAYWFLQLLSTDHAAAYVVSPPLHLHAPSAWLHPGCAWCIL